MEGLLGGDDDGPDEGGGEGGGRLARVISSLLVRQPGARVSFHSLFVIVNDE